MTQKMLATIARVIYGIPFLVFGLFHLMKPGAMADKVLMGAAPHQKRDEG